MKRAAIAVVVVTTLAAVPGFGVGLVFGGEKIVYRPPETFADVPAWVVTELKAQKCRIPQAVHFNPKPHNLIRGEFVTKGQVDWVALCSNNDRSSILLLSRSKQKCARELASADDIVYVQQVAENQFEFSRVIETAGKTDIARYVREQRAPSPLMKEDIDHEGITDAFVEKSSSIFYCKDGKWVELQGAD